MRKYLFLCAILCFVIFYSTSAWAKEQTTPELALNEAVARALAHSEAVKKAAKEIDRTKEWREYRADELGYTPLGPPGNPLIEINWANLLAADLTWRMSKKSLTTEEDAVALDACNKYWTVQKALGAVDMAEVALKQASLDLARVMALYREGMLIHEDLLGAEAKQAAARAALAKAQNDLEAAYAAFNQLIGLDPEDRPVLTDELTFTPMEKKDLDYIVARVLEESPSVWLAQEKVNLQKHLEDLAFYTGEYRPYKARKIEVEQAELDAVSAKEATEIVTRNLYYAVCTLEESYHAAEQAVELAEENLRVAKLKMQVGMAIEADVASAEASLAEARQSLLELKKNHAYYKLALEKPWAYMKAYMTSNEKTPA